MKWLRRHIPTQDSVHRHRLLRPFARHLSQPALWRLSKRSVPRAVALGLFVGLLIPVMHTAIAAIFAIPTRANIAVTAAFTLVVNPLTIPPIYYAAYRIGAWELHHDASLTNLFWFHQASGSIFIGVLTLAIAGASIGYFTSAIVWRWWVGTRWRRRSKTRRTAV